jgi:hypothetical protein
VAEQERPRLDREARRAERARINRLSRLPFLYDYAQRGLAQAVVATFVQVALAIALTLGVSYLVTGKPMPTYAALIALAVAYGLQAVSRYLNARAGRR